ncbi:MAG: protein tyrosine phosphatase (PTP) superfamily phosphohydrolase (DUF442 family) [Rhodothermales bacterium]|jgi:protein tyrosine phosphatase (PTP) superfamily phosphohydrolase (DUF442 family)
MNYLSISRPLATLLVAAFITLPVAAQTAEEDLASIYNYVKISDDLATAGQIAYDQIKSLKEAGYEVVVNLAVASEGSNALEGFLATEAGLTYVQIPVSWQEPSLRDLEMFFNVMEMNRDRKVFVHCFANMRASAFTYLYRTLVHNVPESEARAGMTKVWDPAELEQWAALIERARESHETTD